MTRSYLTLTADEISAAVRYEPETGSFFWVRTEGKRIAGQRAERKAAKGYCGVTICGAPVLCHRLAWFMVHGHWPEKMIDHRNGVRRDNRIDNLRHGTRAQNMQNLRRAHRDCTSQRIGAYFDQRRGKWYSSICSDGRSKFLGYFGGPDEASAAYVSAKRVVHEFNTL